MIEYYNEILIHTSVKLVTKDSNGRPYFIAILIHTSVKLVTRSVSTDKWVWSEF